MMVNCALPNKHVSPPLGRVGHHSNSITQNEDEELGKYSTPIKCFSKQASFILSTSKSSCAASAFSSKNCHGQGNSNKEGLDLFHHPPEKNLTNSPLNKEKFPCLNVDSHKPSVGSQNSGAPQKCGQPDDPNNSNSFVLSRRLSGLNFWRRALKSRHLPVSTLENFIFKSRRNNQRRSTLEPTSDYQHHLPQTPTGETQTCNGKVVSSRKLQSNYRGNLTGRSATNTVLVQSGYDCGNSFSLETAASHSSALSSKGSQKGGSFESETLASLCNCDPQTNRELRGEEIINLSQKRRHSVSHQPVHRRSSILNFSKKEVQQQPQQQSHRHFRFWSSSRKSVALGEDRPESPVHGLRRLVGSTFGLRSSFKAKTTTASSKPFSSSSLAWLIPFKGSSRYTESMGLANCCAGRDDDSIKARAKEKNEKTWDFLEGGQILSDVDKFDKAYAANDIKGFVDLLNSAERIESLPEKMHPWAADPKTVGALATTQLAILSAKDDPTIKDKVRDSGAIPLLVKNLNSKEDDLLHASVVALSFLSVDSPRNCIEILECGALPTLIKGMESPIEGLRGATAQTCRNIYVLDLKYRADFKKYGGIQTLVKILDLPSGSYDPENLFNQLEAVYHLEDLILEGGEELPEYVSEVKKAGAVRRLEALVKVQNQDLIDAAQYLLVRLAD